MAVAANADLYASKRLNIFFKGVVPSLDGQCVSLVKWFMQEMSSVPNPQAARGDARYVGKRLVAEGHAVEVPYSQRRRGDLITYEYGTYGHIGVVLSGNRTFEENVNWPGVSSKIIDGSRVYASRIGSLSESWRHDQHIYRLKSYKEQEGGTSAVTNEQKLLSEPIYDDGYYAKTYPDLAKNGVDTVAERRKHWLNSGVKAGRSPNKMFSPKVYLANNPDLQQAYGTDYVKATLHYFNHGIKEGRKGR